MKTVKKRVTEATMHAETSTRSSRPLYLEAKLQCDGAEEAGFLHRMAIAQTGFG